jgi:sortase (surface protein transpeptidase)
MVHRRRLVWAIAAIAMLGAGVVLITVAALGVFFTPKQLPGIRLSDSDAITVFEPGDAVTTFQGSTTTRPAPHRHSHHRAAHSPHKPAAVSHPANFAPTAVRIPSVGISSLLIRLGLNRDNTLQVPTDFSLAGWYVYRSVPGEPGPSVIAGHIDSRSGPAVFYRLKDVPIGAPVEVTRSDGSVAVFTVTAKEEHSKLAFPTARVYGPTSSPELHLITCGGTFNASTGHYDDNIIVFAKLAKIVQ